MTPSRYHVGKPPRVWKHYPKGHPMRHPWNPRRPLKESYSKHASTFLIIRMGKAEKKIRAEIEREQVRHLSRQEIQEQYGEVYAI